MKLIRPYILALIALLLYSCNNDEVLVDNVVEQEPVGGAISFEQGYVDKSTRSSIALSDYQTTMGVWGYRTPNTDNEKVFINQKVDYANATGWTYSPLKYWDVKSDYDFYAYSPYDENTILNTASPRAYLININNIELTGVNLQATAADAEKMIFNGTADTDWMIARSAQKNILGSARETVQFNMQHILSKLNVRMRVSADMAAILGDSYVTVDKITVGKFICKGDFSQILNATPVSADDKLKSEGEFTLGTDVLTLQSTEECKLKTTNMYLLESLVMPQVNDDDDVVYIEYTIHYADHTEKFKYTKKLSDISDDMRHFYTGYNYTMTFVLDPDKITFTANAANWDDNQNGNIGIY